MPSVCSCLYPFAEWLYSFHGASSKGPKRLFDVTGVVKAHNHAGQGDRPQHHFPASNTKGLLAGFLPVSLHIRIVPFN